MGHVINRNDDWYFMPQSLKEYDVSESFGFLSDDVPLKRLEDEYYEPWELIISDFVNYQLSGRFREKILERAYTALSFMVNGYVWCLHEKPEERLPKSLAIPFSQISEYFDISPITTNAAVVLWNWKTLDKRDDMMNLNNLATIFSFTGSPDEAWFYLVSTAIECRGGEAIKCSRKILNSIHNNNPDGIIEGIDGLSVVIKDFIKLLSRMYERNDPHMFYWKTRPYLAGWENMESAGLKNGVLYEGTYELDTTKDAASQHEQEMKHYKKLSGGSAAQSSILQVIDIILGIRHYNDDDTDEQNGTETVKAPGNPYLLRMRDYMPGQHRKFLIDLERVCKLREYVIVNTIDVSNVNNEKFSESIEVLDNINESKTTKGQFSKEKQKELLKSYNKCVSTLKAFRDSHITLVRTYIVDPAIKSRNSTPAVSPKIPAKPPIDFEAETNKSVEQNGIKPETNGIHLNGKESDLKPLNGTDRAKSEPKAQNNRSFEHGLAKVVEDNETVLGTGGTDAIGFLKKIRDETTESRLK
ncbi:hypothetical protein BB558_001883 [Smittium angustum]|uniref:Indoleamine 2,3-dioxygenase n=1 Tax=Smittium angustum TaxID=133377 RepID=A0A2U1JAC6_SMIAN|nr:hypothetical protein BB558_001883 [Smittium angustum]